MSLHSLVADWSIDGPTAAVFLAWVGTCGLVYAWAATRATRWPPRRTFCFLAGLAMLVIALYSGIGTRADDLLSLHMVEHTLIWIVAAPLLLAAAPIRLALKVLPRGGRRSLGRQLHAGPIRAVANPIVGVLVFDAVVVTTHVPAVFGLSVTNQYFHELVHALYLTGALLMWAPLIAADPVPSRPRLPGCVGCLAATMLPMLAVALWLGSADHVVYSQYVQPAKELGISPVADQRVAATVMWVGGVVPFLVAVPAWALVAATRKRRRRAFVRAW